jgi:predicted TIM-barrel fold metal-dependent hydrolase
MQKRPLVVDADGHILEPPDLWTKNLPAKFRDVALRTEYSKEADGDALIVERDKVIMRAPGAGNIGAARFPESKRRGWRGVRYTDGDPAGFDPGLRAREHDREGIDIAFMYPSLGLYLNGIEDREHARLACEIYNDWLADYCRHDPGRMYGVALVPWQDPPAAATELRRAVERLGFRGFMVRPNAYNDYLLHSKEWDVVWAEAQDLGVPVGLHPGGTWEVWGAGLAYQSFLKKWTDLRIYPGLKVIHFLFDNYFGLTLMVGTGVLERFPRLKVIVLETGGGWLPHWLDQMDHYGEMAPYERDGLSLKPSEYFKRQCWISCDPDDSAYRFLPDIVGDDRILWATDFPHFDVTAPSQTAELMRSLEGVPERTKRKILGENALEVYGMQVPAG